VLEGGEFRPVERREVREHLALLARVLDQPRGVRERVAAGDQQGAPRVGVAVDRHEEHPALDLPAEDVVLGVVAPRTASA
jgi:hypothetical protein